jgi:hypothetical protein
MEPNLDELLEWADLIRIFKLSEGEIRGMIREKTFPAPSLYVGRGKRKPRWTRRDIQDYILAESVNSKKNPVLKEAQRGSSKLKERQGKNGANDDS